MARVKIEEIIDHLDTEIRRALRDSVKDVVTKSSIDEYKLFRAFKREVYKKCNTWENVPDDYVEK